MKEARKVARLERAGWKTVSVQDFLSLSDEEMAVIEVKVALAKSVRDARSQFSELIHGKEAVIVTSNGKPAAVVYPLSNPEKVPMEVRRELFREFSQKMARSLKAHGLTEEDVLRDFAASKKRRRG